MFGIDGDNQPERPGIEELYESATNASSLKHYADRRTAADVLRDMAISAQNLGGALRRVQAEWASVAKPKRATEVQVQAIAERLRREDEQARTRWGPPAPNAPKPDNVMHRARAEAAQWFDNELRLLANSLKSRPAVWEHLGPWLAQEGIEAHVGAAALLHWLDHNCPACHGTRWETVAGTNRQGANACRICHGSGVAAAPFGQDGRKVANHLDQCLHRYKQNLNARRKALQSIPPIDRLSKRMQSGGEED